MKILHIYRTYFPDTQGGLEEAIRQICLSTTALGVENRILCLQREPGEAVLDLPEARVYRSPRHLSLASCDIGLRVMPLYRELLDWCDLVHYHFPWPFGEFLCCVAGGSKPYVVTYHSDIVRQKFLGWLYRPLMRRFLKRARAIVATSQNYVNSSSVLARYPQQVEVVPLGLNEASYPQVSQSALEAVREKYGQDFFLFIGVFRYYKGLHILLSAIKGARYRVVLAGEGEMSPIVRQQASTQHVHNVDFAGFVSDEEKMALLQLCRAVVFPSHLRSEAFGVTLLEAAMLGKPMISTEVGTGTSFVNDDGNTGKVVKAGSAVELREAMDYLAVHEDEARRMGVKARARFELLFTGEVIGAQYCAVYEKSLSGD